MGVRFPSVVSNTIVNATVVTTAETVIATTPAFSPPVDGATVLVFAYCTFTIGASTNVLFFRLRRGTTTSGQLVQTVAAQENNPVPIVCRSFLYFDQPSTFSGLQWSLTVAQQAATGNGTVNDVCIMAFAL